MSEKIQKKIVRAKTKRVPLLLTPSRSKPTSAYDKDFYKWATDQSSLLQRKEFSKLDIENLIEEIDALGRSEKRTLESFFKNLLIHLLKIIYQPSHHTSSWDASVKIARIEISRCLKDNPSLKPKVNEIFKDAYTLARLSAAKETGLEEKAFPKLCPWTIEKCLNENEFPAVQKKEAQSKHKKASKKKDS